MREMSAECVRLEMLWESTDPHQALSSRFGFDDADSAARWLAGTLRQHWNVEITSCERIVISAGNALAWIHTAERPLLAKWSVVAELFPRLREFARLTAWLGAQGSPVSAPIPAVTGDCQIRIDGVSMCLQPVIEGELLDPGDAKQVHAAGVALAELHHALAGYPYLPDIAALTGDPVSLEDRIASWLDSDANHRPQDEVTQKLRSALSAMPEPDLPRQLVHMDFRSANVLFTGSQVAAILDFEQVRVDHCVADLAWAAVMIGTRYHNWGPVPARTQELFLAGYRSVRALSPAEESWLRTLVLWSTLQQVPPGGDPAGWLDSAVSLG